jgi:hypothetical protein
MRSRLAFGTWRSAWDVWRAAVCLNKIVIFENQPMGTSSNDEAELTSGVEDAKRRTPSAER